MSYQYTYHITFISTVFARYSINFYEMESIGQALPKQWKKEYVPSTFFSNSVKSKIISFNVILHEEH